MAGFKNLKCPNCGAPITSNAHTCRYCGSVLEYEDEPHADARVQPHMARPSAADKIFVALPCDGAASDFTPQSADENKANAASAATNVTGTSVFSSRHVCAILMAFLGGVLGLQYLYLGKIVKGVFCIIFCWTAIPAIIGFFHALSLLFMSEQSFNAKYPQR